MRLPDGHVGGRGGRRPARRRVEPRRVGREAGGPPGAGRGPHRRSPSGKRPSRPGPVMTSSTGLGAPDAKRIQLGSLAGPSSWESKDEKERQAMSLPPGLEPRPPTSQTS